MPTTYPDNHVLFENITVSHVIHSDYANDNNIDNTFSDEEIFNNLVLLATNIIHPLINLFGESLNIVSAYRSPAFNDAIDGETDSLHMQGKAIDINVARVDPTHLYNICHHRLEYRGVLKWEVHEELGINNGYIHVPYDISDSTKSRTVTYPINT